MICWYNFLTNKIKNTDFVSKLAKSEWERKYQCVTESIYSCETVEKGRIKPITSPVYSYLLVELIYRRMENKLFYGDWRLQ